ncbi:MAG: (2Fe-2S)-binding protein [Desulfitibacter sp. BRH_c19]|nr:MAG: (2Fe-2S)-binding protein [Desulfitibacter sp. BRH_c19]
MSSFTFKATVNGKSVELNIATNLRLLNLLRDVLELTGTKEGCGEGECGACTVIVDGEIVNSCLLLAAQVNGTEIITIEGVANGHEIHPIQQSFIDKGAVQCGYCIPGMVLAAKALLDKNPKPTKEEIALSLSGNVCRCTGYAKIAEAVEDAAHKMSS